MFYGAWASKGQARVWVPYLKTYLKYMSVQSCRKRLMQGGGTEASVLRYDSILIQKVWSYDGLYMGKFRNEFWYNDTVWQASIN
jgi:hypothetical protein